jgi:hypothetical protein
MDDLISRQAAIDALDCINGTEEVLRSLPPAQPEPQWIPVSERVPYIDMSYPHSEHYLVQYDSGDMDVASWSNVNRFWTDHVTKPYWNCVQFAKVIAWMPLPEAYKPNNK